MSRNEAYIAAHRFGLGPKPDEIRHIGSDPRGWLIEQLHAAPITPKAMLELPASRENVLDWWDAVMISVAELVKRIRNDYRALWRREAKARLAAAITTEQPFRERLVWFWGNHFTVSGRKAVAIGMAGGHEREAIRPHVTGRFQDMLYNATSHPGMLFYLDNYASVGPHSYRGGVTYYNQGLNENLAREILELHTLGVDGGYSQQDVREFAKMLTGWTFGRRYNPTPGAFHFREKTHEPGDKVLLGRTFRPDGVNEGRAALEWLAGQDATARHLAFKLARHFIADQPPPAAVDKLARTFMETEGDLMELAQALVNLPEAWDPMLRKFKTPQEYVVGAMRAVGGNTDYGELMSVLTSFGQLPFMALSPAGWPDKETAWLNPDSALRRARFAVSVAGRRSADDPGAVQIAANSTGDLLPQNVLQQITEATNPKEALALLLASPTMQRR